MIEAVRGQMRIGVGEEGCRGVVELGVVFSGVLRMGDDLLFQFSQTERDGFFNLLREVEIVSRNVSKERVDEMEATQVFPRAGHLRGLGRLLISCMNSFTSRNSL